jgi:hypothetical protein
MVSKSAGDAATATKGTALNSVSDHHPVGMQHAASACALAPQMLMSSAGQQFRLIKQMLDLFS